MSNKWSSASISELGEVISGGTPSSTVSEYWDGDIVWITPADLSKVKYPDISDSLKKITKLGMSKSSANLIPRNSIVISSRAPIGYCAVPSVDFCTNQGCKSIKLNKEQNSLYHYYNILFNINKLKRRGEGTTFAEISKKELEKVELDFPINPGQQEKIAKILKTCDEVIEKTEKTIAKYKAIKQGMMQDLFTRGIEIKTGKLRPKYEDAPELYKESELGWIPKEWDVDVFDNLCLKVTDRDHFTPTYFDSGVPIISPKDFDKNDQISFEKCRYISQEAHLKNRLKTDLETGDLVFTRIGAGLGKVAIVEDWMPEFSILHSACMIRTQKKRLLSNYLLYYMKSQFLQKQIGVEVQSIGVPDLGLDKIKLFKCIFPNSLDEQKVIHKRFNSIQEKISLEEKVLLKHKDLKQGLMQDLLTGKVEVEVTEEEQITA